MPNDALSCQSHDTCTVQGIKMVMFPFRLNGNSIHFRAVRNSEWCSMKQGNGTGLFCTSRARVLLLNQRLHIQNGNGTEIHQRCGGDKTANGRARVLFQWNGNVNVSMPPIACCILCTPESAQYQTLSFLEGGSGNETSTYHD